MRVVACLVFPPSLIFLARTIECAEQEHIFVNFDEKGFFHQKKYLAVISSASCRYLGIKCVNKSDGGGRSQL